MATKSDEAEKKPTPVFPVHYIKSGNYHEVTCDGAIGGLTPKGSKIWMGLYAERLPLPQTMTFAATPTGAEDTFTVDETKPPVSIETRHGMVRTVEVSAYFDLETAKRLAKWLGERITQLEGRENAAAVSGDGVNASQKPTN